jgi:uncharacterized protein (TIGR03905 family)
MMVYTRKNVGTCSSSTSVEIEDGIIKDVTVIGGCNGNLKGIMSLLKGMTAEEAIKKMDGITCGYKDTSCPDQIAQCLKEAIKQ